MSFVPKIILICFVNISVIFKISKNNSTGWFIGNVPFYENIPILVFLSIANNFEKVSKILPLLIFFWEPFVITGFTWDMFN